MTQPTPTWRALADRLAAALTVCCRCQLDRDLKVVQKCTPCKRLDEYRAACAAEAIVQTPEVAARMSAANNEDENMSNDATSQIRRFTAYRRNISQRDTHTAFQKNADDEPQFEGVIWTDGTVSLRWRTACRSTSVWLSVADMLNIHGHPEYGTDIVWHDAAAPAEWASQVDAYVHSVQQAVKP